MLCRKCALLYSVALSLESLVSETPRVDLLPMMLACTVFVLAHPLEVTLGETSKVSSFFNAFKKEESLLSNGLCDFQLLKYFSDINT